jgi:hypothetical protein
LGIENTQTEIGGELFVRNSERIAKKWKDNDNWERNEEGCKFWLNIVLALKRDSRFEISPTLPSPHPPDNVSKVFSGEPEFSGLIGDCLA